ncbi:MAG TPA: DNA adenine methylase [Microbacteriaceae bacterium]|nr:DNA adenine methylase [Microbacteriaceae bacterium]
MIKYLGSKRTLVGAIGRVAEAVGARNAVDLFTGTTRVAQELKRRGLHVTAVDIATYSEVLADCYIATDAASVDEAELADALDDLRGVEPRAGYFTETFCVRARYFQPKNGMRVDAMRDRIEARYAGSPLHGVLLTALLEATDRVDSTTGIQMAYLKEWAPRAHNDLELRRPQLLPGPGRALRGDAMGIVDDLPRTDFLYVDPPYNQHRYFTNYHVWETLVRWDAPEHYGIACKRIDARDEATKSVFNRRREMPVALADLLRRARAGVVAVSYNDEAWITAEEMLEALRDAGHEDARLVGFDRKRYVGAQIGIHNRKGVRVGTVSHLRNTEYLFIAGPTDLVENAVAAATAEPALAPA